MKLLLFLISLVSLALMANTCNKVDQGSNVYNESDTLSAAIDTFTSSVDTNTTIMDSLSPTSSVGKMDTVSKENKYNTSSGKHEAPKHGSPNQEKIDSIKAAKKKKKD